MKVGIFCIPYTYVKNIKHTMDLLTEKINRILILLEDSHEEQDWDMVEQATENLEELYEELERAENVFEMEY